jgi:ABC-type amino acid transport substrate-binding protein
MMVFKRILAHAGLMMAALACLIGMPAQAQSVDSGCSRLVMVGHPDYPPFSWAVGKRLIGVGPSLMEVLAADAGVELELRYTESWPAAQQMVMRGNADGIYGLYRNAERAQWLTFLVTPIAEDEVAVIVPKGKAFPYKDRNSLIGKRGVTSNGESYEDSLDTFITTRLDLFRVPGQAAVLRTLVDGKADYAIVPLATAMAEARTLKIQDRIEVLSKSLLVTRMFIAIGRQSPCRELADRFNRKLKALVSNGTVKRMTVEANELWDQRNELR